MSKLITNTVRHVDGTADNITLDSSQNVTVEANLTVDGQAQVSSDLDIASDIRHIGDTDTKIRFPAADTVTVQTGGTERVRVDSSGRVGIGTNNVDKNAHSFLNLHRTTSDSLYMYFTNSTTGETGGDGLTIGLDGDENAMIWNRENTNLRFATNGTERMTINSSGAVTKPSQPCSFYRTLSNSTTTVNMTNTAEDLVFTIALRDQGSNYNTSNGRFTAPVAGTYAVGSNILVDYQASTNSRAISIKKNGNHYATIAYDHAGGAYTGMSGTGIVELAANDYITIHSSQSGIHVGQESNFWCYLLG